MASKPSYVYVASSWRCAMQPMVISVLNAAGIEHYDFRHPPGGHGFSWAEVMPSFDTMNRRVPVQEFIDGLAHPRSVKGFESDYAAMSKADTFILVQPCGRSAHLELGWAIGQGKRTAVLLEPKYVEPDLMYLMCDKICTNMMELLEWLGVED